jgi:hypothetical protein
MLLCVAALAGSYLERKVELKPRSGYGSIHSTPIGEVCISRVDSYLVLAHDSCRTILRDDTLSQCILLASYWLAAAGEIGLLP